jgi:hypothetical protein
MTIAFTIFGAGMVAIVFFGEWLTYRDLRRNGKRGQHHYGPYNGFFGSQWFGGADETVKTIINDGAARTAAMVVVYLVIGGIALHFVLKG